jgi:hypothetical protein
MDIRREVKMERIGIGSSLKRDKGPSNHIKIARIPDLLQIEENAIKIDLIDAKSQSIVRPSTHSADLKDASPLRQSFHTTLQRGSQFFTDRTPKQNGSRLRKDVLQFAMVTGFIHRFEE